MKSFTSFFLFVSVITFANLVEISIKKISIEKQKSEVFTGYRAPAIVSNR
jgi:hypothetical protein